MNPIKKSDAQKFVRKIKTFLKQAGITAPELAESIGLKRTTLNCWLNGSRSPSAESVIDFTDRMTVFRSSVNAASAALDNFFVL